MNQERVSKKPLTDWDLAYLRSELSEEMRGFPWPAYVKARNLAALDLALEELIDLRRRAKDAQGGSQR